jgi:VanZ family protein
MKARTKKLAFYYLPPLVWMGLIFFLSSFHTIQVTEVHWQNFLTRKAAHIIEYAVLSFLYFRVLNKLSNYTTVKKLLVSFLLAFLYALTDEYHQTFVPGRTGKFFDLGVDFLGALAGTIFCWRGINLLPEKVRRKIL